MYSKTTIALSSLEELKKSKDRMAILVYDELDGFEKMIIMFICNDLCTRNSRKDQPHFMGSGTMPTKRRG